MPMITVDLFEGRTRQQREAFAKEVTEAAVRVLKAPADHTWVIFRNHPKSHWAMGGSLCDAEPPQSFSSSAAQGSRAPTNRRKRETVRPSDSTAGGRPGHRTF